MHIYVNGCKKISFKTKEFNETSQTVTGLYKSFTGIAVLIFIDSKKITYLNEKVLTIHKFFYCVDSFKIPSL